MGYRRKAREEGDYLGDYCDSQAEWEVKMVGGKS